MVRDNPIALPANLGRIVEEEVDSLTDLRVGVAKPADHASLLVERNGEEPEAACRQDREKRSPSRAAACDRSTAHNSDRTRSPRLRPA
jgi:hypothetical protein